MTNGPWSSFREGRLLPVWTRGHIQGGFDSRRGRCYGRPRDADILQARLFQGMGGVPAGSAGGGEGSRSAGGERTDAERPGSRRSEGRGGRRRRDEAEVASRVKKTCLPLWRRKAWPCRCEGTSSPPAQTPWFSASVRAATHREHSGRKQAFAPRVESQQVGYFKSQLQIPVLGSPKCAACVGADGVSTAVLC